MRPGPAADPSPPSSAAVMKEYSYTSTHPLGHTGPVKGSLYLYLFIYHAVQRFHIFLSPSDNYIIFFFHLSLSFQSSSINPFSPITSLISSDQVSLGLLRFLLPGGLHFITFFWQSPLFHSLNMSIPFKLFSLNIV